MSIALPANKLEMAPSFFQLTTLTILVFFLTACSGGSSKNSEQISNSYFKEYTGFTNKASLDITNSIDVSSLAIQSIDLIELLSLFNGENSFTRHVLTGGDFNSNDTDDDCSESGSSNILDKRSENGTGDIDFHFIDCLSEGVTIDGIAKLEIRSDFKTKITTNVKFDGFSYRFSGEEEHNENMSIYGNIITEFDSNLWPINSTVWTANLFVKLEETGRQHFLKDFVRTGTNPDYSINGSLYLSDQGFINIHMDSDQKKIDLSADNSEFSLLYSIDYTKSGYYLKSVKEYELTFNSSSENIPLRTLNLSTDQLVEHTISNQTPEISWNDVSKVSSGQTILLQPDIFDPDSFLEYNWSLLDYSDNCEPQISNDVVSYRISSPCFGSFDVELSVFDGKEYYTHTYSAYIEKEFPSFSVEAWSTPVDQNSSFSLNSSLLNPDQGPFQYDIVYGWPGATISEDGIFSWSIDQRYPAIAPNLEIHYGFGVSNDNLVVKDIAVDVSFKNFEPMLNILYQRTNELDYAWAEHHGAIDLEPLNPSGDIAFTQRRKDYEVLVKYNKSTKLLTEIGPIPNSRRYGEFDTKENINLYKDWNGDGIKDLIYTYREDIRDIERHIWLKVYDLKNEQIIYQHKLFSGQYISWGDPLAVDLHLTNIDDDSTNEIVFLLNERFRSYHSAYYLNGIYAFDPDSREVTMLKGYAFDEVGPRYILAADIDLDETLDVAEISWESITLSKLNRATNQLETQRSININNIFDVSMSGRYAESFMLGEFDEHSGQEILLVFDASNYCGLHLYDQTNTGSAIALFDNNLNLLNASIFDSDISAFSKSNLTDSDTNIFAHTQSCTNGENTLSYLNPRTGSTIWKETLLQPGSVFETTAFTSATAFTDSEGNKQIAIGTYTGLLVTQ